MVMICTVCSFLHFWESQYGSEDGDRIRKGAAKILQQESALH
jgi:hypothetical protein